MVKNLNAQYLGGRTATGLAVTGGEGFTKPQTDTAINSAAPIVASKHQYSGPSALVLVHLAADSGSVKHSRAGASDDYSTA